MIKIFGKELNLEEMFIGAFIQAPFYFIIGWWVLLLMAISAILWALGGAANSNKLFRRLGVPVATSVAVALTTGNWLALAFIPLGWGALSIGYGIPSTQPPDAGSFLGRFFLKILKTEKLANLATRLTIYSLYWISFIVIARVLSFV
jgi:hypothetical protein